MRYAWHLSGGKGGMENVKGRYDKMAWGGMRIRGCSESVSPSALRKWRDADRGVNLSTKVHVHVFGSYRMETQKGK